MPDYEISKHRAMFDLVTTLAEVDTLVSLAVVQDSGELVRSLTLATVETLFCRAGLR